MDTGSREETRQCKDLDHFRDSKKRENDLKHFLFLARSASSVMSGPDPRIHLFEKR
jgi:hypothetical protein